MPYCEPLTVSLAGGAVTVTAPYVNVREPSSLFEGLELLAE